MLGFLLKAAGYLLANPSSITNTDLRDALIGIWGAVQALTRFLTALFGDEMTAWRKAGPNIVAGGKGIGDLAYHELYAWDRLLHVILPGSQRWQQYNTRQYVNPKFYRVWRFFGVLDRRTKFLNQWRTSYVNPRLDELSRFRRFMLGWPLHTLAIVHDWMRKPALFAKWATPILVPSFLQWFAPPHHPRYRDDLTRIVVSATPDMPDQIGLAVFDLLTGPVSKP